MKTRSIIRGVRLVKQYLDARDGYAIGIIGRENAIDARLLSFINYGLCKSARSKYHPYDGLHLGKPEHFQYIVCDRAKFIAYLKHLVSLRFDIERLDLALAATYNYIECKASIEWDNIREYTFLNIPSGEPYDINANFRQQAKAEIRELRENPLAKI